jgi:hypothetical protein
MHLLLGCLCTRPYMKYLVYYKFQLLQSLLHMHYHEALDMILGNSRPFNPMDSSADYINTNLKYLFKSLYKRLIDPALQRVDQPRRHADAGLAHHAHGAVRTQGNERHLAVRAGPHRVLLDSRPFNQVPEMMGQVLGLPLRLQPGLGGELAIDLYPGAVAHGKDIAFGVEVLVHQYPAVLLGQVQILNEGRGLDSCRPDGHVAVQAGAIREADAVRLDLSHLGGGKNVHSFLG